VNKHLIQKGSLLPVGKHGAQAMQWATPKREKKKNSIPTGGG